MKNNAQVIFVRDGRAQLVSLLIEPVVPWSRRGELASLLRGFDIYIERIDTITTGDHRFTGLKVYDQSGISWSRTRDRVVGELIEKTLGVAPRPIAPAPACGGAAPVRFASGVPTREQLRLSA